MAFRFLYPEMLFSLVFLAIPVIIHLFNFRKYKRVYFTNVRFLKEVTEQTQSRSRLKHLLVLLSRLLMLFFLILAFAQPFIPINENTGEKVDRLVNIYVDNSFSMNSAGKAGTLLEEAKRKAYEIAGSYKNTDRFRVFTNELAPGQDRIYSKDQIVKSIDEIKPGPDSRKMSEIVRKLSDKTETASRRVNFLISDFQKSISDFSVINPDSASHFTLVPLQSQTKSNIAVDSCWFENPITLLNQPLSLIVRVRNFSDKNIENLALKVYINGKQKGVASINAGPKRSSEAILSFTLTEPGWQEGKISITDYPVTFDNDYHLSFFISESIPVLNISPKANPYIKALFTQDPFFTFTSLNETGINYSSLNNYRLIILDQPKTVSSGLSDELKKFVQKGGHLVFLPALNGDVSSYNSFLQNIGTAHLAEIRDSEIRIGRIELQSDVFRDVFEKMPENTDFPTIRRYFTLSGSGYMREEKLLLLQDGQGFLSRYRKDKGFVYLFACPVEKESTNFGEHALFVPTFYKIAVNTQRNTLENNVIGSSRPAEISSSALGGEEVFHLTGNSGFDIIPEHINTGDKTLIFTNNQVKEAGVYRLTLNKQIHSLTAFNYNRNESETAQLTLPELKEASGRIGNFSVIESQDKELGRLITRMTEGIKLWKICIILALLFLIAELLLIKFMK